MSVLTVAATWLLSSLKTTPQRFIKVFSQGVPSTATVQTLLIKPTLSNMPSLLIGTWDAVLLPSGLIAKSLASGKLFSQALPFKETPLVISPVLILTAILFPSGLSVRFHT